MQKPLLLARGKEEEPFFWYEKICFTISTNARHCRDGRASSGELHR